VCRACNTDLSDYKCEPDITWRVQCPSVQYAIRACEPVLTTPHSAALAEEVMRRMGVTAAEDILRVHRGDQPQFCANVADLTPSAVGAGKVPGTQGNLPCCELSELRVRSAIEVRGGDMSKVMLFRILALAALMAPDVATAQTSVPDLRGTWTGESETVVVGGGNTHHPGAAAEEPEFRSVAFTLTIDKKLTEKQ
jgi:hypothetical protein